MFACTWPRISFVAHHNTVSPETLFLRIGHIGSMESVIQPPTSRPENKTNAPYLTSQTHFSVRERECLSCPAKTKMFLKSQSRFPVTESLWHTSAVAPLSRMLPWFLQLTAWPGFKLRPWPRPVAILLAEPRGFQWEERGSVRIGRWLAKGAASLFI